jgi:D-glycero-alpha-D-manno-heptose-7-phosphate kinase
VEDKKMLIRARAPLRISFAGGGTDVSPYSDLYGGCALNATIDKYAYTSLQPTAEDLIEVHSLDYDFIAHYKMDDSLPFDGQMDLAKAVIRRLKRNRNGVSLTTHNDAPPGSGLGSSSAMVVSLVAAFKEWLGLNMDDYQVAKMAHDIERFDLGLAGGKQDQYACTFGGFNFIEFQKEHVLVNPLRVNPDVVNELEYNMLLYYTGKSRLSADIIEDQVNNVVKGKVKSLEAMHDLKQQAIDMKRTLLVGDTRGFGTLLDAAWQTKKNMGDKISNPVIDETYEAARRAGAIGGKVSGAGGGGFMMFYCDHGMRYKVAEQLEQMGGKVVNFMFEQRGVHSWKVNGGLPARQVVFARRESDVRRHEEEAELAMS